MLIPRTKTRAAAAVAAPAPQHGDLVVTRDARSSVGFTVRQVPGGPQLCARGRDEALRLAMGFARRYSVDVWYCEKGAEHLVDAHRTLRSSYQSPLRAASE